MKYADVISKMTLNEKADFCSGGDYWHLNNSEKLEIPSIMMTDGPHGLRKKKEKKDKDKIMSSVPAVCFPTAAALSNSWDPDLIEEMGKALGEECLQEKVSVILGPGVNIKRSPLCGRNFEYYSEDPFLAGSIGAAFVKGVQSKGVGVSVKHFAANNQETRRMTVNSVVDERALREIYLYPFEKIVKEAKPWTIMNAYNRLNGVYCSENKRLLTDILRKEWGFDGIVVTDWGANDDKVEGLKAGQDLEMPSSNGLSSKKIVDAVKSGELDETLLDETVDRILDLIYKAKENIRDFRYDKEEHHALCRKIAGESAVLLKNDGNILPLDKTKKIAVIGEMAKTPRYQGAGSSLINPIKIDDAFNELLNEGVSMVYAKGYDKNTDAPNEILISEAVSAAMECDVAVVFAGLIESYETEGHDRTHMRLPESHNKLIEAISSATDKIVVVLSGGSPFEMPWIDKVNAVLHGYLGGEGSGGAIADILLGKVNPSGKLSETLPFKLSDNPSYNNFPGYPLSVFYKESVYVGYRYYDTAKKDILFPFGFGLSYTTFEYSDIKVSKKNVKDTDAVSVSFKIKNTGARAGAEIAELYVKDEESTIFRPEKELKGFRKVYLEPNEGKRVSIKLDKRSFSYYDANKREWRVEPGKFDILVGASSRDIRLETFVNVSSDDDSPHPNYKETAPSYYSADIMNVSDEEFSALLGAPLPKKERDPKIPLNINNTLEDAKSGKAGALICGLIDKIFDFMPDNDPNQLMMRSMALQIPIRCMISMSMGVFTEKMAEGLIDILNGKSAVKGVGKIIKDLGGGLKNIKNLFSSI